MAQIAIHFVSFPACAPNTAKYNYMRTLMSFQCNKLFLLDDFGTNNQGCYLIENNVEKCCKRLIMSIVEKCDLGEGKKIIFIGSSKGGYSAVNFSFLIPGTIAIIGAPQYYLGTYLDKPNTKVNLEYLIGSITEEKKEQLNNRLKNRIATSKLKPNKIYIHYSNVEHTYNEHVKDLLQDLKNSDVKVIEDVAGYPEHSGLANYFPPYLVKTIKSVLENEKNHIANDLRR